MAEPPRQRAGGRLRRLSRQLCQLSGRQNPTSSGTVQATIPYRKLTEDGSRLVYMPDGDAYDMRPHPVEDLRELGETSLLTEGYVMVRNVSRANTALLCARAEGLEDEQHLREVAAERLAYKLEMEALASECFPGHTVRMVMAGGPMGDDGVPNGNVFTRMSELPPGIVPGPDVVRRGGPVKASGIVHSDIGEGNGPNFARAMLKAEPGGEAGQAKRLLQAAGLPADALQSCRHIILQLWRPITDTPVQMDPLAVLDPRSVFCLVLPGSAADLVDTRFSDEVTWVRAGASPKRTFMGQACQRKMVSES